MSIVLIDELMETSVTMEEAMLKTPQTCITDTFLIAEAPLGAVTGNWVVLFRNGTGARSLGAGATTLTTDSAFRANLYKTSSFTFNPNQSVSITVAIDPSNYVDLTGLILRGTASTSAPVMFRVMNDPFFNQIVVYKQNTVIQTFTGVSLASGDTMKASIIGDVISVYKNGGLIGTVTTDGSITSGQPGLYFTFGANFTRDRITSWTACNE